MATRSLHGELRSPHPVDHLAAVLVGRDGVVQVWEGGRKVATVSEATATLLARAVEAVSRG